jgi:hypothetical protein
VTKEEMLRGEKPPAGMKGLSKKKKKKRAAAQAAGGLRKKKKKGKGKKKKAPSTAEMVLGPAEVSADPAAAAAPDQLAFEREQELIRQREEQQRAAARAEMERTMGQGKSLVAAKTAPRKPSKSDEEDEPRDYRRLARWGGVVAAAALLLYFGWSWFGFDTPPAPPPPPAPLDAVALAREFEADSSQANAKYVQQTVRVGGKVQAVEATKKVMVFERDTGGQGSLVCRFSNAGEMEELEPGTNVIIQGTCWGQRKPQSDIVLGNCFILKVGAVQTAGVWENPFGASVVREQ